MNLFERKEKELGVRLNDVQKKAVLHEEGKPLLLLASPGSGKTMTMIMRIGHLITEESRNPERLLAITFSRASAVDMSERFERFFGEIDRKPSFSTIHSLCFRIVREWTKKMNMPFLMIEGNVPNRSLRKQNVLGKIYREITGEWLNEEVRDELNTHISFIKNRMLNRDEISKLARNFEFLDLIYDRYETFKKNHDPVLLDYDDMLTLSNQILENDIEVLTEYQNKYDHVLTDESQDTSIVQYAIINKLVEKHQNLFVVGDDDQGIYSWRGGSVETLINFKEHYPSANTLFLEQNYRSTKEIVNVSNEFIKRNEDCRYKKNMFTENQDGQKVEMHRLHSYENQLKKVVEKIKGVSNLEEVAVLFRNTNSAVPLIHLLDKEGIPFYQKDETNRFFSHFILNDIKNYCRLAYQDSVKYSYLLRDIIPRFRGYITKPQMKKIAASCPEDMNVWDAILTLDLQDYKSNFVKKAKKVVPTLKNMTPVKAIQTIRKDLEYNYVIKSYAKFTGKNEEVFFQYLDTLERIAKDSPTLVEFFSNLSRLENIVADSTNNISGNVVTLSTFHSAKGLEFDNVFMIDLQSDVIPSTQDHLSYRDGNTSLMEEAARLFYVGMTRAKKELTLLHYGKKSDSSIFYREVDALVNKKDSKMRQRESKNQKTKGRFITENDLMKDTKINHKSFGQGVIQEVADDIVTIKFEDRVRRISKDFCINGKTLKVVQN